MAELVITQSSGRAVNDAKTAMLASGDFVVVWCSGAQDGRGLAIYGQRYGADGNKMGGEFLVRSDVTHSSLSQSVMALDNGNFVVVWANYREGVVGWRIHAQIYGSDGTKLGSAFPVSSDTTNSHWCPSITGLSDGNFVVVWSSHPQYGGYYDIHGQRYRADGSKLGGQFQVNTYTENEQFWPSVTGLNNGDFVVVWCSNGQDGSGDGVYGQIYGAGGSKLGSEFRVNTYTAGNQDSPSITTLSNGHFIVVWHSNEQDGSGLGIYGQRYGADGSKLGGEFGINGYTAGNQTSPSITSLTNGKFVVVWYSDGQEGGGPGVHCQVYDSDANKLGVGFKVSTLPTPTHSSPKVTKLKCHGAFIVTYIQGEGVYAVLDDVMHGLAGDDVIEGKGGPDRIDGGEGYDTASYASSPAGVQIDLTAFTAKGGDAEGDTLVSIENLIGSPHSDQLTGNRDANVMHGQAGDDIIDGRAGADDLDGGDGNDTVTYRNSPAGVTVSLVKGVIGQGGDARGDLLLNFENLTGSQHSDKLTGDHNDNIIQGLGGGDDLDGGDGIDTLSYESHDKVVNIDLFDNGSTKPRRGGDTFNNFENIIGSLKSDTLSGDNKPN
ncbi:hypothetical protein EDM53_04645, partial [Rickettsiales endosymbiont of Peranema trichophorum]